MAFSHHDECMEKDKSVKIVCSNLNILSPAEKTQNTRVNCNKADLMWNPRQSLFGALGNFESKNVLL
jgi:hypothetical protein